LSQREDFNPKPPRLRHYTMKKTPQRQKQRCPALWLWL